MEVLTGCKVVLDEPKHTQLVSTVFSAPSSASFFWERSKRGCLLLFLEGSPAGIVGKKRPRFMFLLSRQESASLSSEFFCQALLVGGPVCGNTGKIEAVDGWSAYTHGFIKHGTHRTRENLNWIHCVSKWNLYQWDKSSPPKRILI